MTLKSTKNNRHQFILTINARLKGTNLTLKPIIISDIKRQIKRFFKFAYYYLGELKKRLFLHRVSKGICSNKFEVPTNIKKWL